MEYRFANKGGDRGHTLRHRHILTHRHRHIDRHTLRHIQTHIHAQTHRQTHTQTNGKTWVLRVKNGQCVKQPFLTFSITSMFKFPNHIQKL